MYCTSAGSVARDSRNPVGRDGEDVLGVAGGSVVSINPVPTRSGWGRPDRERRRWTGCGTRTPEQHLGEQSSRTGGELSRALLLTFLMYLSTSAQFQVCSPPGLRAGCELCSERATYPPNCRTLPHWHGPRTCRSRRPSLQDHGPGASAWRGCCSRSGVRLARYTVLTWLTVVKFQP